MYDTALEGKYIYIYMCIRSYGALDPTIEMIQTSIYVRRYATIQTLDRSILLMSR